MVGVSEETLSRELKTNSRVRTRRSAWNGRGRQSASGQAESGKSTMLQNLHPYFAPSVIHAEAEAWRAVIHLNRFHYVNYILSGLASMSSGSPAVAPSLQRATAKRSDSGKEHRRFQMHRMRRTE